MKKTCKKLFGTDGIRGAFGQWPLTRPLVESAGMAAGRWLKKRFPRQRPAVVIGKDTRASGTTIERWLRRGLAAEGVDVYSAGVVPTPGLAYLAHTAAVQLGIMISASHNPADDNGIKFFKHNGYKLHDREEERLERLIAAAEHDQRRRKTAAIPPSRRMSTAGYLEHLAASAGGVSLAGRKIVVDCAQGAVCGYAVRLFEKLGAAVVALAAAPDGKNINHGCGSLYPEMMAETVKRQRADMGFSFDGDGDRVIVCDERGVVRDGDYMMAAIARYLLAENRLPSRAVVGTSMSNFGLEKALAELGVSLVRADVGDKYVLQEMFAHKTNFGGEQSGHIIFLDYATTGDGMLTAVQLARMAARSGKPLSRLMRGLKKYPQLLVNVRVRDKRPFAEIPAVNRAVEQAQRQLAGNGRLVLRYSGTEPLARVMVEGGKKTEITALARKIAAVIERELGAGA
ncbi:MAG: phosphoglucosamine mutase [Candidatus Omnitrophica bacterium]|nr:phosphoglucosamine mutase [Candidatus Omnitrophota bacterium]